MGEALTNIQHDGELIEAGEEVKPSDVGGRDNYKHLVEIGSIEDSGKPNPDEEEEDKTPPSGVSSNTPPVAGSPSGGSQGD